MATRRNPVGPILKILSTLISLLSLTCLPTLAQKSFFNNWIKINTDQYGFVVGSNQKDSLYFVTFTNGKVTRDDYEIDIFFPDGKAARKAKFIDQFDFSGENLALYFYLGTAAKKVDSKYYEELNTADNQKYSLLVDGAPINASIEKTYPFIHKTHKAVFQEVAPSEPDVYYFNKSGGKIHQGMPLLNESGKSVIGIVSNNDGAIDDRFSIIKITTIASRLERWDRSTCRYFNLIKEGESMTPCEQEKVRKEEERLRHIKEDIERKNRTRQERKEVRRNSDYWFSAGPSVSGNLYSLTMSSDAGKEKASGYGCSVGMNIYYNPNPNSFTFSLRPRYNKTILNMPEEYYPSLGFPLQLQRISIKSYEVPIVWETSDKGPYIGLGYVPAMIAETILSYQIPDELASRNDEIVGGPKYLHKLHFEIGVQSKNFRATISYQHQFGTFINKQYEMIVDSQIVRPFESFKKKYYTWSVEISYRLWSQWRNTTPKV